MLQVIKSPLQSTTDDLLLFEDLEDIDLGGTLNFTYPNTGYTGASGEYLQCTCMYMYTNYFCLSVLSSYAGVTFRHVPAECIVSIREFLCMYMYMFTLGELHYPYMHMYMYVLYTLKHVCTSDSLFPRPIPGTQHVVGQDSVCTCTHVHVHVYFTVCVLHSIYC